MVGYDTVSYTHLDVYKRQTLSRARATRVARYNKALLWLKQACFGPHLNIYHSRPTVETGEHCLSTLFKRYTEDGPTTLGLKRLFKLTALYHGLIARQ